MMHVPHGIIKIDISADGVILTVPPGALVVCTECPDLHIVLSPVGTATRLREIAGAFLHLAEHLDGQETAR